MAVFIETDALRAFLHGILSCKCPVTQETEKELFDLFFEVEHQERIDFHLMMGVADKNPERTPLHNLFDFCGWSKDDPASYTITTNDVLRYLGSSFHYNMVVSNHPGIESNNPELLISHLLIPVTLGKNETGFYVMYKNAKTKIRFNPVFIPEHLVMTADRYAVHMGVVLCSLTRKQEGLLNSHQNLIKNFFKIIRRVNDVDLKALSPYGDHFSQVCERFDRNDISMGHF